MSSGTKKRVVLDATRPTLYHEGVAPTENGYWVEAKDLREGDIFLGANGELSTLVSSERQEFPDGITVYNFSVDGNHDYFVIAQTGEYGQTCILVHNAKISNYGNLKTYKDSRIKNMGYDPHSIKKDISEKNRKTYQNIISQLCQVRTKSC